MEDLFMYVQNGGCLQILFKSKMKHLPMDVYKQSFICDYSLNIAGYTVQSLFVFKGLNVFKRLIYIQFRA